MALKPAQWDLEVDVLSVGSGLGGLTSAIVAHDAGKKVAVLEKAPKLGGVCAYSGGEVFVPANHKMREEGVAEAEGGGQPYFQFLSGGYNDKDLLAKLLKVGPEAAEYLESKAGLKWKIIKNFPDYHHPHAPGTLEHGRYLEVEIFDGKDLGEWQPKVYSSPHMPLGITHDELFSWGGLSNILLWDFNLMGTRIMADQRGFGPGMMAYFVKAAMIDREIPAYLNCPAVELVVEDGRVIGVKANKDGEDFFVGAKDGVILGIGGYDWNQELAKYFEHLPEWQSMCLPHIDGDNIRLGSDAGAGHAGVPSFNLAMFFGFNIPGEEHDGKPLWRASWEGGYPHAIWVNQAGKRFCDESFYRDYLPRTREWDGCEQSQPNYPPYLIFDQNFRDKYPLATYMPGQPVPEEVAVQADTLEELAEKMGIDAKTFLETVERFNQYAEDGVDPDFQRGRYPWANMMIGDKNRKNPNLGPVNKAPFYGMRLTPVGAGVNAVGLKTNEYAQVVHTRGQVIEGLYAVGNSAAVIDTGAGYQSGIANLRGMTWGYVAGRHAAGVK